MDTFEPANSMDNVTAVLASIRGKGVRIWAENGDLRCAAPKGVLSPREIEKLKAHKAQIIASLENTRLAEPTLKLAPSRQRCAPLSFSQLAHWHQFKLGQRPSIRQVSSATRLCGPLNQAALRDALTEICRRHDALRTRVVIQDSAPVQQIDAEPSPQLLKVEDLEGLPDELREAHVQQHIDDLILEPIDVAEGPLFGALLLRLGPLEHLLVVAMEHLISDGWSMNIVLGELFDAYIHRCRGEPSTLTPVPVQFPDYAVWRRRQLLSWIDKNDIAFNHRLAGCERLRFPQNGSSVDPHLPGWGVVPIRITALQKARLQEWARTNRSTLVMTVFTAYVMLVLRWCNVSASVIGYQSDGRTRPKLEGAVGYFASRLYLRVTLLKNDTFIDLLNRVTGEWCRAHEQNDFSYWDSQVPPPGFTRNTCFNWVPQLPSTAGLRELMTPQGRLTIAPAPFVDPWPRRLKWDSEPLMLLYDNGEETLGGVYFALNRLSVETMEPFTRQFQSILEGIPEHSRRPLRQWQLSS